MPLEAIALGVTCLTLLGLIARGRVASGEAEEDKKQVHAPHPPEDWYDRSDDLSKPRPVDGTP